MLYGLVALVVVTLILVALVIRRELYSMDEWPQMIMTLAEPTQEPAPVPEPEPTDSFQDDRVVTGQLLPVTEYTCRVSDERGNWTGGKKETEGIK